MNIHTTKRIVTSVKGLRLKTAEDRIIARRKMSSFVEAEELESSLRFPSVPKTPVYDRFLTFVYEN